MLPNNPILWIKYILSRISSFVLGFFFLFINSFHAYSICQANTIIFKCFTIQFMYVNTSYIVIVTYIVFKLHINTYTRVEKGNSRRRKFVMSQFVLERKCRRMGNNPKKKENFSFLYYIIDDSVFWWKVMVQKTLPSFVSGFLWAYFSYSRILYYVFCI